MSQSAVVPEQVCLQQPFELSETVALSQFGGQRVAQAWSSVGKVEPIVWWNLTLTLTLNPNPNPTLTYERVSNGLGTDPLRHRWRYGRVMATPTAFDGIFFIRTNDQREC